MSNARDFRKTPFWRKRLPWATFSATLLLISANLLVYLLNLLVPETLYQMALQPAMVVHEQAWWQVFTYMYVHSGFSHILFNMLGLFFFGMALEQDLGSWEFLLFYHLTGVLAGLASLGIDLATGQTQVALMGASGAIFAVILAFAAFRPQARVLIFFVIPLRARSMVILYTAIEVFSQLFNPYEGIAHLTHLAGFAFGFLYLLIRFRLNAWKAVWI